MAGSDETDNADLGSDANEENDNAAEAKSDEPDKEPAARSQGKGSSDAGSKTPAKTGSGSKLTPGPKQVWHSGNWKTTPSKYSPYNGLEITGLPQFDDTGKFVSAAITFDDYTNSPDGVTSELPELQRDQDWVAVPQLSAKKKESAGPAKPESDDNKPTGVFTVGGKVGIQTYASGIYLGVELSFGPEHQPQEELGNIFELEPPKSAANKND